MAIFYNSDTNGFYNDAIHRVIPQGSIEVTASQHAELVYRQGEGMEIVVIDGSVTVRDRAASITWDQIRTKRDQLLTKSDWTQLMDSPLESSVKIAWAEYRQKLRDVTSVKTPNKVVWPTSP